ncbi:MAG: endonuclease III domain-containing protein [Syntrophomonadaceae bacterium]|nr:endonuclease III domain-containing protein [Syntrophomonadaceae bacterium]
MPELRSIIGQIYKNLYEHYGPRGWWPADSQLEVIIGAILTQAVAWKNVEKAIENLKGEGLLGYQDLLDLPESKLADLIKPALYNRQKAKKIKAMLGFIELQYQGQLESMFQTPLEVLRSQLLGVWGIGPETADSILLYAGHKAIFVVDTYTKRIFYRLGLVEENISYAEMQDYIQAHLARQVELYNEFHALLVALGAECCHKKRPQCLKCPLKNCCQEYTLAGIRKQEVE